MKNTQPGKHVTLHGWVHHVRDIGKMKFVLLRNREGMVQITAKKGVVSDELFKKIDSFSRESCITITGKVVEAKQVKGGFEIIPEKMDLVSTADSPLPLETSEKIESGLDTRFDYRFIDLRNPELAAIVQVRSLLLGQFRSYFEEQGLLEVHTPVLQKAGAEGGSTLFSVKYYGSDAFIRQSPQLYKQILMGSGLDKIYEIGPAFRAEKFHTRRHVSEFTSLDVEFGWIESEEDVLKFAENMIVSVLKGVKKQGHTLFDRLGVKLEIPELPFKRVTYDDCLKILEKSKEKVEVPKWGEDMEDAQEKVIGEHLSKKGHNWFFITKYPSESKPFYIMKDGKLSRGIDLSYKGMELASGGQREHRYDQLVKNIKESGLKPKDFTFYTDAFRYGMPPHGGFGLGFDRLVQQITNMVNVKEVILFPRTPERIVP